MVDAHSGFTAVANQPKRLDGARESKMLVLEILVAVLIVVAWVRSGDIAQMLQLQLTHLARIEGYLEYQLRNSPTARAARADAEYEAERVAKRLKSESEPGTFEWLDKQGTLLPVQRSPDYERLKAAWRAERQAGIERIKLNREAGLPLLTGL
jgi:hypothetical protein